jgi:hypothetical protein
MPCSAPGVKAFSPRQGDLEDAGPRTDLMLGVEGALLAWLLEQGIRRW